MGADQVTGADVVTARCARCGTEGWLPRGLVDEHLVDRAGVVVLVCGPCQLAVR